eukprot:scaffold4079_cov44-Cyclotella_meneghiniana.AAC.13
MESLWCLHFKGFRANNNTIYNTELMKQQRQSPSSTLLALMYQRLAESYATMRASIDSQKEMPSI